MSWHGIHVTIWLNCYAQSFCDVGSICKAIFSCLNRKPDYGFLPYNMPELFNKSGYDLTDIIIA